MGAEHARSMLARRQFFCELMTSSHLISILAVAAAATAAFTDVRDRRIPNRLTYSAALIGVGMQTAISGWHGLFSSLAGLLLFGGVFLLFYIVHGMGAGDVKLAAALGCIIGLRGSVQVMFATALAGGALGLIYMLLSGRVVQTLRNTLHVLAFHTRHGLRVHPLLNLESHGALRMPYGLAFAAGTLSWALITQAWR